jgi:hypothetical protein
MTTMPHICPAENELESLLRRAGTDPNLRDAFYRQLLESGILVQVQTEHGKNGVVPAGVNLGVECWVRKDGTEVIPFFSSPQAFFTSVPSGGKCVVMKTHELFESKPGMAFYLNPGSDLGIEFPSDMVDLMLRTRAIADMERNRHN